MSVRIFIEGGGNTAQLRNRCREAFTKLLRKCGFQGRMPRIYAVGSRNDTFDRFKTEHDDTAGTDYVAMLIDSEDPVSNVERTWDHLSQRDGWCKPNDADDDQVMFMTTCMETWIATDRDALRGRYGQRLNENALPPLDDLENRSRQDVQSRLDRAIPGRNVRAEELFGLLGEINPETLKDHLLSFKRTKRILDQKLR